MEKGILLVGGGGRLGVLAKVTRRSVCLATGRLVEAGSGCLVKAWVSWEVGIGEFGTLVRWKTRQGLDEGV